MDPPKLENHYIYPSIMNEIEKQNKSIGKRNTTLRDWYFFAISH